MEGCSKPRLFRPACDPPLRFLRFLFLGGLPDLRPGKFPEVSRGIRFKRKISVIANRRRRISNEKTDCRGTLKKRKPAGAAR